MAEEAAQTRTPAHMNRMESGDEHDNHCRITFMGYDWWIAAVDWQQMAMLLNLAPGRNGDAVMYMHRVDWDAYCKTARQWLEQAA